MADNQVYIITGEQGAGKTTLLGEVVDELQKAGVKTGGIIAKGTWKNGQRDGFSLVRLSDRKSFLLSSIHPQEGYFKLKRFWFNPEAVLAGNKELQACLTNDTQVVVIDEIGIFELEEKVWYHSLVSLLKETDKTVIITVRNKIRKEVLEKFRLNNYSFFSTEDLPSDVSERIISSLK
jgi:nucleoside-triphosphatase THEP1